MKKTVNIIGRIVTRYLNANAISTIGKLVSNTDLLFGTDLKRIEILTAKSVALKKAADLIRQHSL